MIKFIVPILLIGSVYASDMNDISLQQRRLSQPNPITHINPHELMLVNQNLATENERLRGALVFQESLNSVYRSENEELYNSYQILKARYLQMDRELEAVRQYFSTNSTRR